MKRSLEFDDKINIRSVNEADLDEILNLWQILGEFHAKLDPVFESTENAIEVARKHMQANITKENSLFLLAEEKNTDIIMGYCKGSIFSYPPQFKMDKCGHISELVVAPSYRNQHIGKKLYDRMKKWLRNNKITRIEVSVASANPISPKFWEKMGFKEVRRILYQNLN